MLKTADLDEFRQILSREMGLTPTLEETKVYAENLLSLYRAVLNPSKIKEKNYEKSNRKNPTSRTTSQS